MDLLRLSLERGTTAKHAMEICIHFLETYGQGGPCCQEDTDWTYENSFLFADANEGYVLETAGIKHWAWERIEAGEFRNISNGISIRSNWGAVSKDILSTCTENGWWDGKSKFDWKCALSAGGRAHSNLKAVGREAAGLAHLQAMKEKSDAMQSALSTQLSPRWWVEQMAGALRDEDSGLCFRDVLGGFCSTGSQISWLPSLCIPTSGAHFFTGAPDPLCGTPYKLFTFSDPPTHDVKEDIENNYKTKELWDLWRQRSLNHVKRHARKGLESEEQLMRETLSKMEDDSMRLLECDDATSLKQSAPFETIVQKEIELLESFSGS